MATSQLLRGGAGVKARVEESYVVTTVNPFSYASYAPERIRGAMEGESIIWRSWNPRSLMPYALREPQG
jgi:hypothetical protein